MTEFKKYATATAFRNALEERLKQIARFVFHIGQAIIDLDAAPYIGVRYPVEARVNGRSFVKFHLDVGSGDITMEPLEITEGRDWLAFMGISSPHFKMIPREQQFADKLHAYTLPREGAPNSRVKDLVDMVLLIKLETMDKNKVAMAINLHLTGARPIPFPKPFPNRPGNGRSPLPPWLGSVKLMRIL